MKYNHLYKYTRCKDSILYKMHAVRKISNKELSFLEESGHLGSKMKKKTEIRFGRVPHEFSRTEIRVLKNQLVQQNKQYHMKMLFNRFYLNGHTLRFHPQT